MKPKGTESTAHAIVIGLDCITGLQTARILHDRGVPVVGVATNPSHFACRTKACERVIAADTSSLDLVAKLELLGPQLNRRAVLYPCTDGSVLTVARHRDRLARWFHIPLSPEATLTALMDKLLFARYAEAHDLPVPPTAVVEDQGTAEAAGERLTFPCVVKPAVKTREWEQRIGEKVVPVATKNEWLDWYERCSDVADALLIQEWIPGGDDTLYSCNAYFGVDGEPLVTFVARKLRQWPPERGTSCLGEEVRNDTVLNTTLRLFQGAGFRGLAYLEMKRDPRTGEHVIIEPNVGRPTGRSAIAEAGGVELLYTMYCDAVGLPLPAARTQRYTGVKWVYLRHDAQAAVHYWRREELTPREWWRSWRGRKGYAVFAWRDPAPFVADMARSARLALSAVRSRRSGASQPLPAASVQLQS